jgi:hypothetical protein
VSGEVVNECPDCLIEAWLRLYNDAVAGFLFDENEADAERIDTACEALDRLGYWSDEDD